MFLKKLFSIGVLFYFHFDFAHGISELENWYRSVFDNGKNIEKHIVCYQTFAERAYFCQNALALLRKDEEEYYNWLYVDYSIYTTNNENLECDQINLELSTGEIVPQYVFTCYASSLVVRTNSWFSQATKVSDIAIYPANNNTSVLVVKKIETYEYETKHYNLRMKYLNFDWKVTDVPYNLFFLKRPRTKRLSSLLKSDEEFSVVWDSTYNVMKSKFNILKAVNESRFVKLCTWVFGQETYRKKFRVSSVPEHYQIEQAEELKTTKLLFLFKEDSSRYFHVDVCTCLGFKDQKFVTQYSISAGAQDNSIILYESTEHNYIKGVSPLELITGINLEYLRIVP